jgi:alpha-glucosidase (family GH31 glycosyl hydrolase)
MIVMGTVGIYTPFYHSSHGYGLYVDSTCYGYFDIGCSRADRLRLFFLNETDTEPLLRVYIYYGPGHDEILDEYTLQTGRPFVPPSWAFRHWRWRNELEMVYGELDGYTVNGMLAEDVNMYDLLQFPPGSYLIDRPYTPGERGFAEFSFDPVRFPNVDVMIQSLFDRGYHLLTWGGPWAIGWEVGQNGWEAEQYGYYAPSDRKHIDFTNPKAYEWWKEKVKAFVSVQGIHGWKLDRGDEDHPSGWNDIYYDGRRGIEMRNAYPLAYQRCYYDAMQEVRGSDFINVFRAGYAGSQRYGIVWAGDTPGNVEEKSTDLGLRSAILSQLHCAFMGFPVWGSDTGGFREFRDREVFARWIQFSAFCPLMEIGGTGTHAPWDMPTEPHYDEEMIAIYRNFTNLHHSLSDYINAHALQSGETGTPIVRPMVFDYPEDPSVRDMWDQYFFGRDFLVAPVWRSGQREREVYIPEGDFVDYWNAQNVITGPVTILAEAPLDRIPLFVRSEAMPVNTP